MVTENKSIVLLNELSIPPLNSRLEARTVSGAEAHLSPLNGGGHLARVVPGTHLAVIGVEAVKVIIAKTEGIDIVATQRRLKPSAQLGDHIPFFRAKKGFTFGTAVSKKDIVIGSQGGGRVGAKMPVADLVMKKIFRLNAKSLSCAKTCHPAKHQSLKRLCRRRVWVPSHHVI